MARTNEGQGRLELPADRPVVDLVECARLWSVHDVAGFLGVPVPTLYKWRYLGTGPAAFRVGRHLRYDPAEVRAWLVRDCTEQAG